VPKSSMAERGADLIAQGRDITPPSETISAIVADAMDRLRSTKVRGPFPHPTADDLARSGYLRALAHWARGAALRSRRTLGARGVEKTLDAARRLAFAAHLQAALESASERDPQGHRGAA
jgi:hypothetical protein